MTAEQIIWFERPHLPMRRKGATDLGIPSRSLQTGKKRDLDAVPLFFRLCV